MFYQSSARENLYLYLFSYVQCEVVCKTIGMFNDATMGLNHFWRVQCFGAPVLNKSTLNNYDIKQVKVLKKYHMKI